MGKATRLMLLKVCERGDYDVIHAKSKLGLAIPMTANLENGVL